VRVVHHPADEACAKPHLALTFDDGPVPDRTPELLRLLAGEGAVATFCVIGARVATHADLARAIAARGHLIVNHSWDHISFQAQDHEATLRSVARTREALDAIGVACAPLVRPPYGETDAEIERALRGAGWQQLMWTIDPKDWAGPSARRIVRRVTRRLHPDAIVLLHDGSANAVGTLGAVAAILRASRERGYCWGVPDLRSAGRLREGPST
jgi:peptidoglycan/xylan/chitin deacetylase (PgdA/CDA1 family)